MLSTPLFPSTRFTVRGTLLPSLLYPTNSSLDNAATIHETSELPAMTMSDFKQKGGVLGGRDERYDGFDGEPKHIGGTLKHMMEGKTSKRDSHQDREVREAAMHGDFDPLDGGKHNTAAGRLGGVGVGVGQSHSGDKLGKETSTVSGTHATGTEHKKASLLDKLNPMKDSDGDGKKGIMK